MKNNQKAIDWFKQGNTHYEAKRYEEALRCYDQAVNLDAGNAHAWNNRGICLAELNRHKEAIPSYAKALQNDPKYVAAWCNLGISLSALSRDEEALQCFDKALNFDAKHSIIWQKKGDSLRSLGRREEAITSYETAVKLDDRNALAWYYKALCEDELGHGRNAYFSFSRVISLYTGIEGEIVKDERGIALSARQVKPARIDSKLFDHALERFNKLDPTANPVLNIEDQIAPSYIVASRLPLGEQSRTNTSPISDIINSDVKGPTVSPNEELHALDSEEWSRKGKELID
jgi:tetratricopeptide (TPR) repeat protein